MKSLITSVVFGIIAIFVTTSAATSNRDICASKAPNVMNAFSKFCSKPSGFNVPSNYAKTAHYSENHVAYVSIGGDDCKPAQWVPQQYCYSQFYDICAKGSQHGRGIGYYGRQLPGNGGGRCQTWMIAPLEYGV